MRRHSRPRGREGVFWRSFKREDVARILQAAERYDLVTRRERRKGCRNGALGHVARDVLRELLRLLDFKTGRLDPAIKTLAARCGYSVAAVVDALKRLRAHGFLDWLRRYEPTGNAGMKAPQVRQTSNAYRVTIPPRAEALLRPPVPVSADIEHAQAQAARDAQEMAFSGTPLERLLSRWGAAIAERERDSRTPNESPKVDLSNGVAASRRPLP